MHERPRDEHALEHVDRVRREQPVARGRDHHRIEHDVALAASARARPRRRRSRRRCDSMPIFTASTSRSENTASICAATKSAGTSWIAGDALGVLRGQRGDDRRAVDAERRKCLQVGLDAGAAAGIRARDGDGDRGHAPCLACASAASTMRATRARRLADRACSDSAEITATPSAPAAITGAALLASMPAMPQSGNSARAAQRRDDRARPAAPIGGLWLSFEVVANTPPMPT